MERERKYGFAAFSWADEVEKEEEEEEEEEEAQAQPHQIQKQKTNPFGIDWRKLDQDSNVRIIGSGRVGYPLPNGYGHPYLQVGALAHQNQIPLVVSPPLRYPPKNLIPRLLEESSICCNPCGLDNWQQHFQCRNRLWTEKESACNKQRLQKAHSLDPRSHIHPQLDQNIIWCNSQSSEFKKNGTESQHLVLQMEAQRRSKNLRKSAACMNQQEMRMFNAQNLVGTPLVNERREWKNLQDDHARSDASFSRRGVNNSRTGYKGFDNERPKVARNVTGSHKFEGEKSMLRTRATIGRVPSLHFLSFLFSFLFL
ncbi:hypothetical protein RGQ29_032440 [Quercus rubra]|uniref:Uncharacterized protein n=1 Tax=Quercus rubra TaxID=3512 RepID=A0AAN7I666_QUERU|nr:hypothetical protein RGQ29_032440 [Quercus rubra]